jgi:hypothetical protein
MEPELRHVTVKAVKPQVEVADRSRQGQAVRLFKCREIMGPHTGTWLGA